MLCPQNEDSCQHPNPTTPSWYHMHKRRLTYISIYRSIYLPRSTYIDMGSCRNERCLSACKGTSHSKKAQEPRSRILGVGSGITQKGVARILQICIAGVSLEAKKV